MRAIPTQVPEELSAGDSWQFDLAYADFPASEGWVLALLLRGPADLDTEAAEVTPSGDTFQVRIPGSRTTLLSGRYRFVVTVTKDDERFVPEQGDVFVRPDPTLPVNSLSHDERTLSVIDAALEGRLSADLQFYQIAGRSVSKIQIAELIRLQGIYRRRVRAARRRGRFTQTVGVTFGAP